MVHFECERTNMVRQVPCFGAALIVRLEAELGRVAKFAAFERVVFLDR
jgi:hypothetical protein